MRRIMLVGMGAIALAGVAAELGLRGLGYHDLPLYRSDPVLGYAPREGAAGTFAGDRRWAFNARGMRMDGECRPGPQSLLLLGDSIVHGGTSVSQEQTLGVRLAQAAGREVCPLGAGSWAFENELRTVEANPDFLSFGTIVLVLNSEDFVGPSTWQTEFDHPTVQPRSILLTAVVKKAKGLFGSSPQPRPDSRWQAALDRFLATYRGQLVVVLYPRRVEIGSRSPAFAPLVAKLGNRAALVEPNPKAGWTDALYIDQVHPQPEGHARLAQLIAAALPPSAKSGSAQAEAR